MRALLTLMVLLGGCSLVVHPLQFGNDRDASTDAAPDSGGPPPPPLLRSPWNGYLTGSIRTGALPPQRNALQPRFIWESSAGAERYEIELTSNCDASMRASCTFEGAQRAETSATDWRPPIPLAVSIAPPVGRRYVWHVRACNLLGCSAWSDARYLDVGRLPNDFNGDGSGDLVVGAGFQDGGEAYYYDASDLGSTPVPLRGTLVGGTASIGFGLTVAGIGDTNGDGFADALIAAMAEETPAGGATGRVYLVPGRADAFGLDLARAQAFDTDDAMGRGFFGWALAGAGDVDGDGFADFLITAPLEASSTDGGHAYLYFGSAGAMFHVAIPNPMPEPFGEYGISASVAGDLNGDGHPDVVVASSGSAGAVRRAGKVYVFDVGPSRTPILRETLQSTRPFMEGRFGASAASASDINGDGLADLAIGEPAVRSFQLGTGITMAGNASLHIFLGGRGTFAAHIVVDAPSSSDGFALRMSTSGDVDGDGTHDIVTGAVGDDASGTDSGALYFVRGADDLSAANATRAAGTTVAAGHLFGYSFSVFDQDHDGRADVIAGSLESTGADAGAGAVRLLRGPDLTQLGNQIPSPSPSANGLYGCSVLDVTSTAVGIDF
ncbi:MAG: FG-GAP-like repeat-containing protein [Sandaracinaceae bacterium]|nr:FG-GAP-like repeat-containing protein [Sandaracinaceae bacterium]